MVSSPTLFRVRTADAGIKSWRHTRLQQARGPLITSLLQAGRPNAQPMHSCHEPSGLEWLTLSIGLWGLWLDFGLFCFCLLVQWTTLPTTLNRGKFPRGLVYISLLLFWSVRDDETKVARDC